MHDTILQELDAIEATHDVAVLYACESGSRAWGFASEDSDFDVRFLYVHRPSWYLSIDLETKRDVIERPIDGMLDVSGWDLRKALRLLRKSNPPLLEWLGSPIVYRDDGVLAPALRALAAQMCSTRACRHHYLHMAQGNFRAYLRGDEVWRKKYFYVLRPLLAIRWLDEGRGVVPMEFERLLDACVPAGDVRDAIDALLEEKAAGGELDRAPRVESLSAFIERELTRVEGTDAAQRPEPPPVEPLNVFFREQLDRVFPQPERIAGARVPAGELTP